MGHARSRVAFALRAFLAATPSALRPCCSLHSWRLRPCVGQTHRRTYMGSHNAWIVLAAPACALRTWAKPVLRLFTADALWRPLTSCKSKTRVGVRRIRLELGSHGFQANEALENRNCLSRPQPKLHIAKNTQRRRTHASADNCTLLLDTKVPVGDVSATKKWRAPNRHFMQQVIAKRMNIAEPNASAAISQKENFAH